MAQLNRGEVSFEVTEIRFFFFWEEFNFLFLVLVFSEYSSSSFARLFHLVWAISRGK